MPAYVIFDVEIRVPARYQDFISPVEPALQAVGARYVARWCVASSSLNFRPRRCGKPFTKDWCIRVSSIFAMNAVRRGW